ncbi:MAG: type II toxin-antitoxin system Phd/YefM family antitoxin [Bacteroidales bacterium]|nr:type II toxin-antitoxin system Phd/YefM family antitoxin [Bacteroidales bacterium]
MVQVTSREFREKQASMFELADKGEKIIIRRGKKRAYMLVPVDDNDFLLSPEAEERIERSRAQYRNGEFVTYRTADEAIKFLESL